MKSSMKTTSLAGALVLLLGTVASSNAESHRTGTETVHVTDTGFADHHLDHHRDHRHALLPVETQASSGSALWTECLTVQAAHRQFAGHHDGVSVPSQPLFNEFLMNEWVLAGE